MSGPNLGEPVGYVDQLKADMIKAQGLVLSELSAGATSVQDLGCDEIYGPAILGKVRWQGREYALLWPKALGPEGLLHYSQLSSWVGQLAPGSAVTETDLALIAKFYTGMIWMLCPELAAKVPFGVKVDMTRAYMRAAQLRYRPGA